MARQMLMPNVNQAASDATVSQWRVAVGDVIEIDLPVIEVETDKALVEVPSTVSGKVVRLLVGKGDTVKVGQAILEVE
jgi:pyruvate/2-oxoglutarate dehydrogenase complex dihydrolipoamide acyltransferase (E2) component